MRRTVRALQAMAAAVGLLGVVACGAETAAQGEPPTVTTTVPGSLAGQLLVATANIGDPRFARTVILIIAHDKAGAMGLVINRPFGEGPLTSLLAGFGIETSRATPERVQLFYGGPVEPGRGFVLHSPDYRGDSTRLVDGSVSLSTGNDVLRAIASGEGPKRTLFIIGYAGWGPGQLESEIARDDWLTAPGDPSLVFSPDSDAIWDRALRRAGVAI